MRFVAVSGAGGVRCRLLVVRVRVEMVRAACSGAVGCCSRGLLLSRGDGRAARRAERRRLGERGPAHPDGMRARTAL